MSFPLTTKRRIQACYECGLHWSNWYDTALSSIESYVANNRKDYSEYQQVLHLSGLLAIASPRVQVSRSIKIAKQFFADQSKLSGTMTAIFDKMVDYWNNPNSFIWTKKVGAFYNAIIGDSDAVVVDIHISRAFGFDDGFPMQTTKAANKLNDIIVNYISDMDVKTSPRDTQAAIWCGWLRFQGKEVGELKL